MDAPVYVNKQLAEKIMSIFLREVLAGNKIDNSVITDINTLLLQGGMIKNRKKINKYSVSANEMISKLSAELVNKMQLLLSGQLKDYKSLFKATVSKEGE